jgi:hypothetical protein
MLIAEAKAAACAAVARHGAIGAIVVGIFPANARHRCGGWRHSTKVPN